MDINILSAKYGLLDTSDEIEYYDQRMDTARARELNPSVVESVANRIEESGYERVVINMGATYRNAIAGLGERVDVPLVEIPGSGIGEKGNALYRFIRGEDSVVSRLDGV